MLAAVYHGRRDVRVETVAVPEPGPGEVLLRVLAAGRSEGWADVVKTLVDPWAAQARPTRTTTAGPGG